MEIATVIETLDKSITRSMESQKALAPARKILHAQKLLFETALAHAQSKVRASDFRSRSTRHAELFDNAYKEIEAALAAESDGSREACQDIFADARDVILSPPKTGDEETDRRITREFRELLRERSGILRSFKSSLGADPRLEEHFRKSLDDCGCADFWPEIEREHLDPRV